MHVYQSKILNSFISKAILFIIIIIIIIIYVLQCTICYKFS